MLILRFGVIPILADILSDAQKEKVSRIILAVFRVRKWSVIVRDYNFGARATFYLIFN